MDEDLKKALWGRKIAIAALAAAYPGSITRRSFLQPHNDLDQYSVCLTIDGKTVAEVWLERDDAGMHTIYTYVFAKAASRVHHFASTHEAYDACQTDDSIATGDTLVIESERVVGVADTWPFAVTAECGDLHIMAPGISDAEFLEEGNKFHTAGVTLEQAHLDVARQRAALLGF